MNLNAVEIEKKETLIDWCVANGIPYQLATLSGNADYDCECLILRAELIQPINEHTWRGKPSAMRDPQSLEFTILPVLIPPMSEMLTIRFNERRNGIYYEYNYSVMAHTWEVYDEKPTHIFLKSYQECIE